MDSHSIFDASHSRVGSIAPCGDGVVAYDATGRTLGCFETSLEAASACHRHARLPSVEGGNDIESAAEKVADFWANSRVKQRRSAGRTEDDEDQELIDQIEAKLLAGRETK